MGTLKNLLGIVLLVIFIFLVVILIKIYLDVKAAKEYVAFVTNSSNNLIEQVDGINVVLNGLEYEEGEDSQVDLEDKLVDIEDLISEIEGEKESYKLATGSETVRERFNGYLLGAKDLVDTYKDVIASVKNLEDREIFETKLEEYVNCSSELQLKSTELEDALNEYVQDYTKFDLNRLLIWS
jgi:hypothetical protein